MGECVDVGPDRPEPPAGVRRPTAPGTAGDPRVSGALLQESRDGDRARFRRAVPGAGLEQLCPTPDRCENAFVSNSGVDEPPGLWEFLYALDITVSPIGSYQADIWMPTWWWLALASSILAIFTIMFGLAAFTIVIGVPAAYLLAIFRHGLWELDVVIKKTVIFAIVDSVEQGGKNVFRKSKDGAEAR